MTAYQRDDGAEMVEWKPGFTVRRDVGLRLGLIVPEMRLGQGRAALALAADPPAASPPPEPIAPPPLPPSLDDLVSVAPETGVDRRSVPLVVTTATAAVPAPRTSRPRPVKRSLGDILAEADRNHRALRRKARP